DPLGTPVDPGEPWRLVLADALAAAPVLCARRICLHLDVERAGGRGWVAAAGAAEFRGAVRRADDPHAATPVLCGKRGGLGLLRMVGIPDLFVSADVSWTRR